MERSIAPSLTAAQQWDSFVAVTKSVLSRWTVLRLALDQGWGGRNSRSKADKMLETVLEMFSTRGQRVYRDELEDLLYDFLERDFSTLAEDGSVEEISKLLTDIHYKVSQGDLTLLQATLNAKPPAGSEQSIFQQDPMNENVAQESDSEDEHQNDAASGNTRDQVMEDSDHHNNNNAHDGNTSNNNNSNASTLSSNNNMNQESSSSSRMETDEVVAEDDGWEVVRTKGTRKGRRK